LSLTPVQELTQAHAELEEAPVLEIGKLTVHIYIVTR
jgi:hypothetical protein